MAKRKTTTRRRTTRRRRPVAIDDLRRIQVVSAPRLSPDGRHLAFSVKRAGDKNAYETSIWMTDVLEGGPPRPFTAGPRDGAPVWSPDGRRLAFVSAREKARPQVHVIDMDGGEARALTDFPEGSLGRLRWTPDGVHLLVSFREQDPDWTTEACEQRKAEGLCDPPRVIDDPWYRLDGDGYFNAQRYELFVVDAESGNHHLVYGGDRIGVTDFDVAADGRTVVLVSHRDRYAFAKEWSCELLAVDIHTGRSRLLPDVFEGWKGGLTFGPDGKTLAFGGRPDEDGTLGGHNIRLFTTHVLKGGTRCLTKKDDLCLIAPTLSDTAEVGFEPTLRFDPRGKRVFFELGWHGATQVASVPVRGGALTHHTKGRAQHRLGDVSADGRTLALVVETAVRPGEVHLARLSGKEPVKTRAVSDLNGPLMAELDVARPTARWVTSADGSRVHTWTLLPPGASGKRKLPTILQIHGGPHAQYGWSFFHEFQVLAAAGYAVVFSNPRGSKGYGQEHCDGNSDDWGHRDWEDLQAVTADMQSQPYVDDKRMGIMGGSFGGYMTLWAVGHSDQYRAAIADRCVSNMVSMWGASDIYVWPDTFFWGNTWDRTESLWDMSPLKYLGNCKTPTMLIHSEGDLRCNVAESEQAYAALSVRGVPTRFVRYPRNTSHGMSRAGPPDMRVHRLEQILDWWQRWMKPRR